MRILLIGYGKMGKQIAELAPSYGASSTAIIDHASPAHSSTLSKAMIDACDVAIDFSHPDGILKRIELFAVAKKPLVVGTTGWNSEHDAAKAVVLQHQASVIHSPNFSLGVGLFLLLAKQAATMLAPFPDYDVGINEMHHKHKQDAPSGTALKLAETVVQQYPKKTVLSDASRTSAIPSNCIHVGWQRTGSIPGIHELIFDSAEDTISLTHTARNRQGFAKGALQAARWLRTKTGWYTLEDMLTDTLQGK